MKFKIWYNPKGRSGPEEENDTVIISGDSVEDVKKNAEEWFKSRGMDFQRNGLYSMKQRGD